MVPLSQYLGEYAEVSWRMSFVVLVLSTRASRVANPGGEKLVREASPCRQICQQIELAFSYNVNWIGDGEVITDVFIQRFDILQHGACWFWWFGEWWCGRRKIFVGGVPHWLSKIQCHILLCSWDGKEHESLWPCVSSWMKQRKCWGLLLVLLLGGVDYWCRWHLSGR